MPGPTSSSGGRPCALSTSTQGRDRSARGNTTKASHRLSVRHTIDDVVSFNPGSAEYIFRVQESTRTRPSTEFVRIHRKKFPCGAAGNPPESARIRPSTESFQIRKRHPSFNPPGPTSTTPGSSESCTCSCSTVIIVSDTPGCQGRVHARHVIQCRVTQETRVLIYNVADDVAIGEHCWIGRFRHIAWVKCPYRAAGKPSALRAGKRALGRMPI
jgi:hypothetical protein